MSDIFPKRLITLLADVSEHEPKSLGELYRFIENHRLYKSVCFLGSNSERDQKYLFRTGECLYYDLDKDVYADIQLAAVTVLMDAICSDAAGEFVSRVSAYEDDKSVTWSPSMAASLLLSKETHETIRISA
jgi:hypothetical protein